MMPMFIWLCLTPLLGIQADICSEVKGCILCQVFSSPAITPCPKPCFPTFKVPEIDPLSHSNKGETVCTVSDQDGCNIKFVVSFRALMFPMVLVERRRDCPKPPPPTCTSQGGTGIICNGRGRCVGDSCKCYSGYYGKYCEKCRYCQDYCQDLKHCVQCKVFNTGPLCATNCFGCFEPQVTDFTGVLVPQTDRRCQFVDVDMCSVSFVYSDFGGTRRVFVDAKKQCRDAESEESTPSFQVTSQKTQTCVARNGLYCSGHGRCIDDIKCQCYPGYYGQHCEICKNCHIRCQDFVPCVLCRTIRAGPLRGQDCSKVCFVPKLVEDIWSVNGTSVLHCRTEDSSQCRINFAYNDVTDTVFIDKDVTCPGSMDYVIDDIVYAKHVLLKALDSRKPKSTN